MFNLGIPELILILVVGLVVFGPKQLPEIGRSVGKGLREFKKAMNDIKQTINIESEFKEVAELRKEVTEIKTGLKEVVLQSDTPAGSVTSANSTQVERTQPKQGIDEDEAADIEEQRLSWVKNDEWTVPGWAKQDQNEKADIESSAKENQSQPNGVIG